MQKLKTYLTTNGWKRDLEETAKDVKDISILLRRAIGLSKYGIPKYNKPKIEMT